MILPLRLTFLQNGREHIATNLSRLFSRERKKRNLRELCYPLRRKKKEEKKKKKRKKREKKERVKK